MKSRRRRDQARPGKFPQAAQQRLLELLAAGRPLTRACEDVGVAAARVHALAHLDARWSRRLDDALLAGRDPDLPHGTPRGYSLGCRCPQCRRAKYIERGPRKPPLAAEPPVFPAAAPERGRKGRRLGLPLRDPNQRGARPRRTFTDADLERLSTLWGEGVPVAAIAQEFAVSPNTIYRRARQLDLPMRRTEGPAGTGAEGDALLRDLWAKGVSMAEIGEALGGIHLMTVRHHADRLGLPRRPRGRPRAGSA
ncbi:helix-turn-helix domain-containing protein [Streptomyces sp. DSM 41014]|uniref:Helix-turn-helix domain-containing protein n=1 Tax=Streptomyces hintoniae TaxID=3075521 RepID=A0ABU2USF8_9ACTN|nr:helix-turn-helix domain-containing protein [Streptomyces sp. DSM 41014]MDT0476225.1 helix-turn-helix domain-containing protein [Streptomyces sp. DSM 41014]